MIINALLLNEDTIVSAGWDKKLVRWSIESQKNLDVTPCETYINTLAWLDKSKNQVLAGGMNGYLILAQL